MTMRMRALIGFYSLASSAHAWPCIYSPAIELRVTPERQQANIWIQSHTDGLMASQLA